MKRNLIYHSYVPTHSALSIKGGNGKSYETEFEALSRDGLSILCDRATLDNIMPATRDIAPKHPVEIDVEFSLPERSSKAGDINARCEIFGVRRLSRDKFQLCLRFCDIAEKQFEKISHFIDLTHQNRQEKIAKVA